MYMKKRLALLALVLLFVFTLIPVYRSFQTAISKVSLPVPEKKIYTRPPSEEHLLTHIIRLPSSARFKDLVRFEVVKHFPRNVVVSDQLMPGKLANSSNPTFVHLDLDLLDPLGTRNPFDKVITPYVIISSTPPTNIINATVKHILKVAKTFPSDILILPFENQPLRCYLLSSVLKEWTLKYEKINGEICDAVMGSHSIFASVKLLRQIPDPWMQPFPEGLYVQTAAAGYKLRIVREKAQKADKRGVLDHSNDIASRYTMYNNLKMKKVVWDKRVEWYGCTRNTSRCFGTVVDDTPEYLLAGRWTPPCCLRVLRETARHVFRVLETHGVRYWLEGGSLLGAMRSGDIIPWDYDVDVGVYRGDLIRCPWIRELHQQVDKGVKFPSVVDKKGFVWETSRPNEGRFYRIQASKSNRLHVDVFPFYSQNGVMTKDTWMTSHRQDRAFSESYLKPITKVPFVGMQVSAPNNIHDFLEFKFGAGCIENPEYPNPSILAYPRSATTAPASDDDQ